ncbi:MAG TPA: UPF0182 family protein [Mycetocola sp.]|uniref:UPF0182 family membrane protein n=1 Tax=Mycetocola sp. TaxID=1871042 RepID=UPI00261EEC1D|nr:UPF0182 family protein [Mycetocola sp.]MCU1560598.1 hypothetical protein [Mycetocola sp.]HEV7848923.1 UPF0182 family protein [Mycetocola sp.]
MTSAPSASARPAPNRSRAPLAITAAVVGVLVVAFFIFAGLYSDFLWFEQLGFATVLTTQWIASGVMFVIGFFGMALPVWASIMLAYRLRPVYAKLSSQLDRYQELVEPLRRLATYGIPVVLGLFAGFAAATRWEVVLMWLNRTPVGNVDPQFGLDVSFYFFELPFFRGLVGFASAVILLATLLTIAVTYLYGSIRVTGHELRISKAARIQIAILAALYIALQAVSIWLDQYVTLNQTGDLITGVNYTDDNATIPGRVILAGIATLVAVLFLITAFIGRWRLPVVGTALLLVAGLLVGTAYPWVVQRFQVDPNAKSLETPYIQRNIDLTRDAYDVADLEEIPYNATTDATAGALREDAETTASIRIIDPALVSPSISQLERFKNYYAFAPTLDVDRYQVDGESQDAVVALRELRQDPDDTWVNNTFVYTHGYGLVAAYGNQRSVDGQPVFLESGIPTSGALGKFEPRIYFGEASPEYSIVGAPKGNKPVELDFPSGEDGASETYNTFKGDAGPKLDSVLNKLVYALKFQSEQIFLSDDVTSESQIMYDRDPATRVKKVAPYLTLDSDPYPSVVDGRVVWIVDGYTTSDAYPYSRTVGLSTAIADSATNDQRFGLDDINYIRNSVKATVDAYDGSVTLYAWDTDDAILKTWQKIYPSTLKPMSEMSGELMSHVRYPGDLFKVQRQILGQYHVTDAGKFYSRTDAWSTPADPQSEAAEAALQPPYYLTLQMPGQEAPTFSLYSTFVPRGTGDSASSVLTGYLAVDADAGAESGKPGDGYGKLRLLTLPKDVTVPGPGQVQNAFNTDPEVSSLINLLKQGQSKVLNGNLLTLPVGGGLLYVQPVYVQSTGETSYPLLQKVLVAFGDQIAFEDTLDQALDSLFGGDSGADAGDGNTADTGTPAPEVPTEPTEPGAEPSTPTEPSTGDPAADQALRAVLAEAKTAMDDKSAALAEGDWAAYGEADARLNDALGRALALLNR